MAILGCCRIKNRPHKHKPILKIMTNILKNAVLQQSCITAVKSRFFAQYWGQEIGLFKKGNYSNPTGTIRIVDGSLITASNIESYSKTKIALQLKPLSKATREEVFDTYCKMWEFNEDLIESDTAIAKDWFENYGTQNYVKFNQEQTDFLRSKGYAVPFMEYSVDDLVSFGWVQLL